MTENELTKACWAVYDEACEKIARLVKESGYTVFCDNWSFHRYVKHGETDGVIADGSELLERIVGERQSRGEKLVYASRENIKVEREKIIAAEIAECENRVKMSKKQIVEAEERLMKIKSGEMPYADPEAVVSTEDSSSAVKP